MIVSLILVAAYVWAVMVYSDSPDRLSLRRTVTAPVTLVLILIAVLLVYLVNLLAGTEAEVHL